MFALWIVSFYFHVTVIEKQNHMNEPQYAIRIEIKTKCAGMPAFHQCHHGRLFGSPCPFLAASHILTAYYNCRISYTYISSCAIQPFLSVYIANAKLIRNVVVCASCPKTVIVPCMSPQDKHMVSVPKCRYDVKSVKVCALELD